MSLPVANEKNTADTLQKTLFFNWGEKVKIQLMMNKMKKILSTYKNMQRLPAHNEQNELIIDHVK
jgi:hypothetical protein